MYKNIEVDKESVYVNSRDKIGSDYFSLPNRTRSNHVLNDTLDAFLNDII